MLRSPAVRFNESGGDWDRRNRLKVYEACFMLYERKFERAASLFLQALPTFTCYEMVSYNRFIYYTVVASVVALDRVRLKKEVQGMQTVVGHWLSNVGTANLEPR